MVTAMRFVTIVLFIFSFLTADAQLEAGVKAGISTRKYLPTKYGDITLNNENAAAYNLKINDLKYGFHVGLYSRLIIWKLFAQVDAVINSNSTSYSLEDIKQIEAERVFKEQYTGADFPAVLGLKLGWFNIQGGISMHIPLFTISELKNLDGYTVKPENTNLSYIGGLGFDLGKIRLDFRYELSTTKFGNHIEYKGMKYAFADNSNRMIGEISYRF